MTFGDKLDLIIEKAPGLRAAGVTRVEVDGCKVDLLSKEPEMSQELKDLLDDKEADEGGDHNPLTSAATYGLPRGAQMPGFQRLIDRKRDER